MRLLRLFNEPAGREASCLRRGVPYDLVGELPLLGISSICNLLAAIKTARHFELDADDVVLTCFTDSAAMYQTRLAELTAERGEYTDRQGEADLERFLLGATTDHLRELTLPGAQGDPQPEVLHLGRAAGEDRRGAQPPVVAVVLDRPAGAAPGVGRGDRGVQPRGRGPRAGRRAPGRDEAMSRTPGAEALGAARQYEEDRAVPARDDRHPRRERQGAGALRAGQGRVREAGILRRPFRPHRKRRREYRRRAACDHDGRPHRLRRRGRSEGVETRSLQGQARGRQGVRPRRGGRASRDRLHGVRRPAPRRARPAAERAPRARRLGARGGLRRLPAHAPHRGGGRAAGRRCPRRADRPRRVPRPSGSDGDRGDHPRRVGARRPLRERRQRRLQDGADHRRHRGAQRDAPRRRLPRQGHGHGLVRRLQDPIVQRGA